MKSRKREGKAGIEMSFKSTLLDNIIRKWNKKLRYRSMAWLLIVCLCVVNLNSLAFAVEDGTQASGGATPSEASASEVMMPEETIYGNELLEEAERAITNGAKFDFDSVIRLSETGDEDEDSNLELYKNLFDGYESFTLFYDNDHDGKIIGSRNDVYGYIVVRLTKKEYLDYLEMASPSETSESETDENGGYHLSGNEDLIFLYVNGSDVDATFNINLADMETSEIVIPSLYSFDEEETEDIELTEEIVEEINVDNSDAPGAGGSGSSGVASDDNSTEEIVNGELKDNQEEGEEKTENDTEQEAGEETTEEEIKDSEIEDTNQNDDNQSSGDEAENENSDAEEKSVENDSEENVDSNQKEVVDSDNNESEKEEKASEEKADSDNQTDNDSDDTEKGSDREDKSEDTSSDSFKETEVTIIGKTVPRVMGPNPDATGEEDDDDMSFEEWQEMMEELEEEEETDEEEEYESSSYEEENGTRYLNLSLLPVVTASVRRPQPTRTSTMFRMARSVVQEEPVALGASVVPTSAVETPIVGYSKQIEWTGEDTYRLYLDISGKEQAMDVLLVVDMSGSMKENDRLTNLKKTLIGEKNSNSSGFIQTVLSANSQSRIAVVPFADIVKDDDMLSWTSDSTNIINYIGYGASEGLQVANGGNSGTRGTGTNYEAGLWHAKEMMASRGHSENIPFIIFLSDGVPGAYNKDDNGRNNYDEFNDILNLDQTKKESYYYYDSVEYSENISLGTKAAAKAFYNEFSSVPIYCAGFGISDENTAKYYFKAISYGNENAVDTEGRVITSGDSELQSTFNTILNKMKLENVEIVDKLSDWVTYVGNPAVTTLPSGTSDLSQVGTTLEESKYTFSYDNTTKTVTLDLTNAGYNRKLDPDLRYRVAFDVKVSDAAKAAFNGTFPHTGDENTDFGSNDTSSGKPGFYSNADAYVVAGATGESKARLITYPKPVVQTKGTPYELPHSKYIKDNKDGTYTLTLDVTSGIKGKPGEQTYYPVDVMLVLDKSGSMEYCVHGYGKFASTYCNICKGFPYSDTSIKRKTKVNTAVQTLITQLSQYEGFYYNGVTFSGSNNINTVYTDDWMHEYDNEIKLGTCSDGTYPNAALKKAIPLLITGSTQNANKENCQKHIVLLTDGEPSSWNEISNIGSVALSALDENSPITFHIVSFANSSEDYLTELERQVKAKGCSAKVYSAKDSDELNSVFTSIENSIKGSMGITTYGVKKVVITDTLSEYAEFVDADASKLSVLKNGVALTEEEKAAANPVITISDKTITVTFAEDYELELNATYSISFDVKPTDAAYNYYNKSNGYPHTGDEGTDAAENTSSSGQLGFYSNENAKVSYTSNGIPGEQEYAHPVIQVLPSLVISKTIAGISGASENDEVGEFNFTVSFKRGDSTYQLPDGNIPSGVQLENGTYKFTLNKANNYSIAFDKLPKDVKYTVEETGSSLNSPYSNDYVLTEIKADYDGEEDFTDKTNNEVNRPERLSVTSDILADGSKVKFTNTYTAYGKITIVKQVAGGNAEAYQDETFTFDVTPGTGALESYGNALKGISVKPKFHSEINIAPEDAANGIQFTVKESDSKGAWKTEWATTGNPSVSDEGTVTASEAGATITFTNYYYKHDIVLKKAIIGDDKFEGEGAAYKFNVKLQVAANEELTSSEIDLKSENGTISHPASLQNLGGGFYQFSVELAANQEITINALPKKVIGYEIVEDIKNSTIPADSEYEAILDSVSKQVGTEDPVSCTDNKAVGSFADATTSDQSVTVVFTNKFVKKTVKLTIEKHLVKSELESSKKEDQAIAKEPLSFTFAIKDNSTNAVYYYAVATVEKDQSSGTVEVEVPIGNYTITERKHLKYTAVNYEKDVVVTLNGDNKADFYNYQPSDKYFSDTNVKVNKVTSDGFQKTDPETDKTSTFSLRSILPFAYREEDKEEE
ncbi:MAG: VWA domain-containing protein [Otoolea sp.]